MPTTGTSITGTSTSEVDNGHGGGPVGSAPAGASPGLREFLVHKRAAVLAREEAIAAGTLPGPAVLRAHSVAGGVAGGRSGVRRIRIRDHQILSDSPPDFAGDDLGPSSPELVLGVFASCLTHVFEIVAARLAIPLDEIRVDVEGQMEPRAGRPGFENTPREPHDITYQASVTSPATGEEIETLFRVVEEECPLLALFTRPQTIAGSLVHTQSR
ncbi:putative redox protein, regulator of disulfide bond formation [Frankia sp. AiPs1]|uniref:OsmC family protein n=1 Tax=Frankia sp. AiPa1 TaxID=573492 RepID=UPI00202B7BB9|nr:OsmC family protein [Frankia sp. AiPa1]MCL9761619.1 OsmC family protein [Frankia sp. AiPa1]